MPPKAALAVVHELAEAGLVENSRIVMEKPFGTDLASARKLNAELHEVFREEQIFRIDHFLGKEAAQNILAFRFANGLFEPIWHRNHIDHVQIDVPEELGLDQRADFYESTGAFRDMVVTHLFQVLAFTAMEPPTALEPDAIGEEKNKVFRSMLPIEPHDVVRGQYVGYRDIEGVAHDSETETFVALKCYIDNWRWAGVPFYLRTGKRMAEGARIISIAFREPPQSMFPSGSGVGDHGPDHLTFDLADEAKMSLSFYGKRPGPGHEARQAVDAVRHAGHRLGRRGPRGLRAADLRRRPRATARCSRRRRASSGSGRSRPRCWRTRRWCGRYAQGSWGPNQIHQLVAPFTWRLPFERQWRKPNERRATDPALERRQADSCCGELGRRRLVVVAGDADVAVLHGRVDDHGREHLAVQHDREVAAQAGCRRSWRASTAAASSKVTRTYHSGPPAIAQRLRGGDPAGHERGVEQVDVAGRVALHQLALDDGRLRGAVVVLHGVDHVLGRRRSELLLALRGVLGVPRGDQAELHRATRLPAPWTRPRRPSSSSSRRHSPASTPARSTSGARVRRTRTAPI